jgi:hypothetical protein
VLDNQPGSPSGGWVVSCSRIAADVAWLNVDDALEILVLMAQEADPRFDKAAAR